MPYQNDMSTLADVVGGGVAAQQAGLQNDLANQQEAIKTNIQQATMPQEIQKAQLANNLLQAQGQNEQGVAAQNLAAGTTALQAQPSAAAAQIGGNQAKLTEQHVNQLQSLGQIVGVMDQQLQQVPPAARPALVGQFLDQNGVQDPSIRQLMINAAGQEGGLQQISSGLFQASNSARQAILSENIKGQYQENVAGIQSGGRVQAAEVTANARRQIEGMRDQVLQQKQTVDQRIAALNVKISNGTATPEEQASYKELQNYSTTLRTYAAQTTRALLGMGDFSQPMGQGGEAPGAPNVPTQPGGTTTPPAPTGDAMQTAAKQMWPNDDPTKFDYRVVDGQLYRKPK